MAMKNFSRFRGHICTANADGSIPLSAKSVCEMLGVDDKLLTELLAQANLAKDLAEALQKQIKDNDVIVAFQKYHHEVGTP